MRYVVRKPHLVWTFLVGKPPQIFDAFADRDWALNETERWSSWDALFSKRLERWSGDARLHLGQAACGTELQFVCRDRLPPREHTDSIVARGMMTRRGSGHVKHLKLKALWCHGAIKQGRFALVTAHNELNPADICTKTPRADRTVHLLRLLGMVSA